MLVLPLNIHNEPSPCTLYKVKHMWSCSLCRMFLMSGIGMFWTGISRLGSRCLSAVSAYDNTLEVVDNLDAAQAKFDDILNSPSIDVACQKIKSLAKAKELDSSLILLISSAWAKAKESTTMKNEVRILWCPLVLFCNSILLEDRTTCISDCSQQILIKGSI